MLHRSMEPFLPPAFGCVDGGYQGNLPGMLKCPGGVSHYPVMSMDQVEPPLGKSLVAGFHKAYVKLSRPGDKIWGMEVIRHCRYYLDS